MLLLEDKDIQVRNKFTIKTANLYSKQLIFKSILFLTLFLYLATTRVTAQIGINTDGSIPDSSSILDIKSTNKGLLIPRLSNSQMMDIHKPANGLIVYNTSSHTLFSYYDSTWKNMLDGKIELTKTIWVDSVGNNALNSIQEAIFNSEDGGVIIVMPGTYNEKITITKNLTIFLEYGATISLTGNYSGSPVTIDANCTIIGGTIKKLNDVNGDACIDIKPGSNVYIKNTNLWNESTANYTYSLKVDSSSLLAEDITCTSSLYNGGCLISRSHVKIDATQILGAQLIDNHSTVHLHAKTWLVGKNISRNNEVNNQSALYLTVTDKLGIYNGDYDRVYTNLPLFIRGNSKLYMYNSIWNFPIVPELNAWIQIEGCNSGSYGRCSIRQNLHFGSGDNQTWIIKNSNVKNTAPPWEGYVEIGGSHIFERAAGANEYLDTVNLIVDHCTLEFGEIGRAHV